MYRRHLIVILALFATFCYSNGYGRTARSPFGNAAAGIIMRQIGHQLLLAAGDDTSRVLPVQQVADNEFRISFESPFSFHPDTLIAIVSRNLATGGTLPAQYVVNVLACNNREVVYGFAKGVSNMPSPCSNRKQPADCYQIQILFSEPPARVQNKMLWGAGASLIALTGLGMWYKRRQKQPAHVADTPEAASTEAPVSIGAYAFYPEQQRLQYQQQEIPLTSKESKLLGIFARHLNQLISRDQLQKEGWEEEGVITGRSLDMYVSKLRKHLQQDIQVKLVNVHGRGYRLEVTAE